MRWALFIVLLYDLMSKQTCLFSCNSEMLSYLELNLKGYLAYWTVTWCVKTNWERTQIFDRLKILLFLINSLLNFEKQTALTLHILSNWFDEHCVGNNGGKNGGTRRNQLLSTRKVNPLTPKIWLLILPSSC